MNQQTKKTSPRPGRNQALECCRMIAAITVVFAHVPFPRGLGSQMACLARFPVPFFFMLSGYFSYGVPAKSVGKRLNAMLKLNLYGNGLYLLWGLLTACPGSGEGVLPWVAGRFSALNIASWLFINVNYLAGHLWYISAMLLCYLVLYLYVRWFEGEADYRPLYLVSAGLLALAVTLSTAAPAAGMELPYSLYRNGLLMGLPLFCMGIFLREHRETLYQALDLTAPRLTVLVCSGLLLSLFQWNAFGPSELMIGFLIMVPALLLLLTAAPPVVGENTFPARCIAKFGSLSTYVYVTHLIWEEVYVQHLLRGTQALLQGAEPYVQPLLVVLLSVVSGILWENLRKFLPFRRRRL